MTENTWGTAWTDDEVRYLKKHWPLGESASVIGRALGRSRRSVIGKVARMGLNSRPCTVKDSAKEHNAKAAEILRMPDGEYETDSVGNQVYVVNEEKTDAISEWLKDDQARSKFK